MGILPSGSRFNISSENLNKWCLYSNHRHGNPDVFASKHWQFLLPVFFHTQMTGEHKSSDDEEPGPASSGGGGGRGITKESLRTLSSRAASALTTSRWTWKEPLIHWASFTSCSTCGQSFAPSRELNAARWWPLVSSAGNKLQDHLMWGHRETTRCFSDVSRPRSWWGR